MKSLNRLSQSLSSPHRLRPACPFLVLRALLLLLDLILENLKSKFFLIKHTDGNVRYARLRSVSGIHGKEKTFDTKFPESH